MFILGLTGSIGMGKSTTAEMFRDLGVWVHDADAVVHELYEGELVDPIGEVFPSAICNHQVDRKQLSKELGRDPAALKKLEAIVHPAVRRCEERFLAKARATNQTLVVLDIPLLFETGAETRVDKVLVVSAPENIQKSRVLAREGMTEEKFSQILKNQMPDSEKKRRADIIIDSSKGFEAVRQEVRKIIDSLSL